MCGQRWLLLLLERSPQSARPVQRIYRLCKPLDTASFLAAFRHVVSSHPALRTRLVRTADGWRQCFPEFEAEISGITVRGRTREARAVYAQHLFANDSAQPFDLCSVPPFLARVIEVDGEHYFSLCLDHIAADDLAMDLLERNISEAYLRERQGQSHPPTPATQSFYDYLDRETAQKAKEPSNLRYWIDQLSGHPLGRNQTEEIIWVPGEAHQWQVSGDALDRLRRLCRSNQVSLFALVLAAYVRLLSELAGTDDLVVNVPVSNRTRAVDHDLIANLSMLLHMRFRLTGTAEDRRFLLSVRDQVLNAMAHRHYDYDKLSEIMSGDAAKRGGRIHWAAGCSYIIERQTQPAASTLFEERLDNLPGARFDIPHGGFALTCRQNVSRLQFSADWDFSTWPSHGEQLERRFLEILDSLAPSASLFPTLTAV